MAKAEHCHVVELPLEVNARQAMILRQRLRVVGMLRNALVQEARERVQAMRADERWAACRRIADKKERGKAYDALWAEFGLTTMGFRKLAHAHWKASKWMPDVIDARTAMATGDEVLVAHKNWVFGHTEMPHFKPSAERAVGFGQVGDRGLCLRRGQLVWNTQCARKELVIPLDLSCWPQKRREHFTSRRVLRVGIKREIVRGTERFFALVCLEGFPYRDADYLARASDATDLLGLDMGPSYAHLVGEQASESALLCAEDVLASRKAEARRERNQKRALDRSRRAANPHAFRKDGRAVKGVRQHKQSKRGARITQRLTETQRTAAIHRREDRADLVKRIALVAHDASTEDHGVKWWQQTFYGKRMGLTAPGMFLDALERELELTGGGKLHRLPTRELAASQHCLCGHRQKKSLKEQTHRCDRCGLVCDRNLLSAFLLREAQRAGRHDLGAAPFGGASKDNETLSRIGVSGRRAAASTLLSTRWREDERHAPLADLASSGAHATTSQTPCARRQTTASGTGRRRADHQTARASTGKRLDTTLRRRTPAPAGRGQRRG
jgi:hypothetical protein